MCFCTKKQCHLNSDTFFFNFKLDLNQAEKFLNNLLAYIL